MSTAIPPDYYSVKLHCLNCDHRFDFQAPKGKAIVESTYFEGLKIEEKEEKEGELRIECPNCDCDTKSLGSYCYGEIGMNCKPGYKNFCKVGSDRCGECDCDFNAFNCEGSHWFIGENPDDSKQLSLPGKTN